MLEEIYYFEVSGGAAPGHPGRAVINASTAPIPLAPIDVLAEVSTGDTILIPYGYHGPTMAAPGYDLYFLNVLADRRHRAPWPSVTIPTHAWIRDSWREQVDRPPTPDDHQRG